ncbi:MAG TPA: GAF domain-containing protein [Ktedonobacteraceae bacterium]|jgi:GAF domain-containing protein
MQTETSRFDFRSINLPSEEKEQAYQEAIEEINALLKDENHFILKMATINCILRENLPYYFWTGFYLVHHGELIVGPYQGALGCLHIPFGKGVCGAAAKTKQTQLVPDINKFPGHIACDSRSQSEIVVPVFDKDNTLIAVFDVDSTEKNSFDEIDKKYLEQILKEYFSTYGTSIIC